MSQLAALTRRWAISTCSWAISTCIGLSFGPPQANADETRWRFFDQNGRALLAITDTDEATDAIGSPSFDCAAGSDRVEVRGDANKALRRAIGNVISADQYPKVNVAPFEKESFVMLSVSYSEISGWQYGFDLPVSSPQFERFKQTGVLEFKLAGTAVREGSKVGLDAAAKFQAFCKQQSK
ncbi:hypothetical protein LRP30_39030 [Bradyrhizobium sp. C-145]|uniref:hypothetical protein n=1 Tax=Bradyrhizobium sp. C-145 TaxID=574727 RepID=UPI00201B55CC|nr:hypothetical protein [Bradyrhizobium sp. C-145]UQR62671.1 hypothetical protein LRP30_39030 [Bradyrhizobium sp. C-145]